MQKPLTNLNTIGYMEDPYERKEDMQREEYAKHQSKILNKNKPWQTTVKQRDTFLPTPLTYGTTVQFQEKQSPPRFVESYGPWRRGDLAHTGINKTIGGHKRSTEDKYLEEGEIDSVMYRVQLKTPIWRTTSQMSKSMGQSSVVQNRRNS